MPKHGGSAPSGWVTRWAKLIPSSGKILDLACGSGRHLRWLLERDQPLIGIDIDTSGAQDLLDPPNLELLETDLEQPGFQFPDQSYAAIIVTNYLYRPLLPLLPKQLGADGVLIYETFAEGNEEFGRPSNPDFLLRPDELLNTYTNHLQIAGFEQGYIDKPKPAIVQRICAINSDKPPKAV